MRNEHADSKDLNLFLKNERGLIRMGSLQNKKEPKSLLGLVWLVLACLVAFLMYLSVLSGQKDFLVELGGLLHIMRHLIYQLSPPSISGLGGPLPFLESFCGMMPGGSHGKWPDHLTCF